MNELLNYKKTMIPTYTNVASLLNTYSRCDVFGFRLTIQNTANWHVSNAFDLLSVFISFPLARCAPHPIPPPLFWGREVPKKENRLRRCWCLDMFASACAWWVLRDAMGMGHGVTRGIIERHAGAGVANPPFPLHPLACVCFQFFFVFRGCAVCLQSSLRSSRGKGF